MGKQFNLRGTNGLYLSNKPTEVLTTLNYENQLIEDYDFLPSDKAFVNNLDLKNIKYVSNGFIGSNSIAASNSTLTYSQLYKHDGLIANKTYYNKFKMYFNFSGSDLGTFVFPGFSGTSAAQLTSTVLNGLRLKVYIQLGANTIPTQLSNLERWTGSSWATVGTDWVQTDTNPGTIGGTISSSEGSKVGIHLTTGLGNQSCIDMRFPKTNNAVKTQFNTTRNANGYGFRVDVSLPDFDQVALKNKDYKIIVKYYNIGVTTSGVPTAYTTSESVELMANKYVYYQQISVPIYSSPSNTNGTYNAPYDPNQDQNN